MTGAPWAPRVREAAAAAFAGRALRGRAVRIAVPALAVSALGLGAAFSVPQQSVVTAVPAAAVSAAPLVGRASDPAVSRADVRPSMSATDLAAAKAAREEAAKEEAVDRAAAAKAAAKEEAAAKEAAAKKKASEPVKSGAAGTRYATITLNLRSAPKDGARTGTDLNAGAKVTVTGYTLKEWAQVKSEAGTRWVKKKYLTSSKPKAKAASAGSSAGVSGGACASGSAVERGLTPNAIKVHRAICNAFPAVRSYGGVRADSLPEHPSGRALDAMVSSNALGTEIANWVRANASRLGVSQVIFAQRIWTVQRSSEGWRSMSDRGSASANHYDHVHVTVYG